jgi:hypothetical protein
MLAIGSVSPFVFSQDFTGTWSFYGNGYKGELYLKQDGNQVRGWEGVNGVNLDSDTITGTVNGNEILFTRSNPQLSRPQEFHGFIMLHDNPQIEARRRMTGADAMAGIFSHMGEWKYAWYATRLGPYRDPPNVAPFGISGSWSGTYTNTRGESGTETLDIKEGSNGVLEGLWGGAQIVNGRRSGDALTWEAHVQDRDYKVSGTISSDGKRMTLKYSVIDPSRGNYSGVDELARS